MGNSKIKTLLERYRPGYSLEQEFYTGADVFGAEWAAIFQRHWLFAGNIAQIPNAGDFFLTTCATTASSLFAETMAKYLRTTIPVHTGVLLFV